MQMSLTVTAGGTYRHRWTSCTVLSNRSVSQDMQGVNSFTVSAADDVRKAVLLSRPFRTAVRCRLHSHWTELHISNQVNRFPQPFVIFHPSFRHSWNTDTEYTDHPPPRSAMSQVLLHGAAQCENESYCSCLAQGMDQWHVVVNT
jgi:hypothetical protein